MTIENNLPTDDYSRLFPLPSNYSYARCVKFPALLGEVDIRSLPSPLPTQLALPLVLGQVGKSV